MLDLRALLFNWMWHQGMLNGTDERDMVATLEYDMVATLEYQAKGGTIQGMAQPCTLSKFRASTNYQTFSQHVLHALEQPDLLEHRGGQLAVRVERGHAGGNRRGAGEPTTRCRRAGLPFVAFPTKHACNVPSRGCVMSDNSVLSVHLEQHPKLVPCRSSVLGYYPAPA